MLPPTSGCLRGRTVSGTIKPASSPTPNGNLPPLTARWPRWRGNMKKTWRCARSFSPCRRSRLPAKRICGRCARRTCSRKRPNSTMQNAPRCRQRTGKTLRLPCARDFRERTRCLRSRRKRPHCFPCRRWSLPHPRLRARPAHRRFPGWMRNGFSTRRSATRANLTG